MAERRKPGEVRDAIVGFLKGRDSEASLDDVVAAVEKRLGTVARSSVRSYLNLNVGKGIERTGRGRYRWTGS